MKRISTVILFSFAAAAADLPFVIKPITFTPEGVRIEFQTKTNWLYVIEDAGRVHGVEPLTWSAATTNMPGTGGTIVRTLSKSHHRLYRIRAIPAK